MNQIISARIDDRLLHGQVAIKWIPYLNVDTVIIIDDELFSNPFLNKVTLAAAPKNIKTIIATENSIDDLLNNSSGRILLLAKRPQTFEEMIKKGIKIPKVNVGGIGYRQGRMLLHKNIYISNEEMESLKNIEKNNVKVEIQIVPDDSPRLLSK